MGVFRLAAAAAALLPLCACGGSARAVPPPGSGPVTFASSPGLVCCTSSFSIEVQAGGTATKSVPGSPAVTVQLPASLTAAVFADVRRAWPLDALSPAPPVPDSGGLTVSWGGQTSPDISNGGGPVVAALDADYASVNGAFGPAPLSRSR